MSSGPLFKITVVIWSDWNPKDTELDDLSRESQVGDAYCSERKTTLVEVPEDDPRGTITSSFPVN